MTGTKKIRMTNFELLRCIAMMMVIVLHLLGKGGILPTFMEGELTGMQYLAWVLESLSIVAVNVYMLISGYFLVESKFSLKRVAGLWMQLLFYSVGIGLVAFLCGLVPEEGFSIYYLARLVLPVSKNHYWFMTAYIAMYLFAPILSAGVRQLGKKQFQAFLLALLFLFSAVKSIVPMRLETDNMGYDVVWYLCVFLVAAYIRLYGIPFLQKKGRGLLLYFLAVAADFGMTYVIRLVYLKSGKLGDILTIGLHYNHILVLLASIGLFYTFYNIRIKEGMVAKIVCAVAPLTLGVYLLHCHTALDTRWQQWLYQLTGRPDSVGSLLLCVVVAVVLIFLAGILVDSIRRFLFRILSGILRV